MFTPIPPRAILTRPTPTRLIRTPFPGNIIPLTRQSPIGVRLLSDFPDPNYRDPNPNVRNNYLVTESNVDSLDSYNIKTDVNLRRSDTLAAHITEQKANRARSSWMPNSLIGATAQINGINSGINETHVILADDRQRVSIRLQLHQFRQCRSGAREHAIGVQHSGHRQLSRGRRIPGPAESAT